LLDERLRSGLSIMKWPTIVLFNTTFLFGFLALILRSPEPNPLRGHTFLVHIPGRGRWISAYTEPWIGQTFVWLFYITVPIFVAFIAASIYLAAKLKEEGDEPPSSTS